MLELANRQDGRHVLKDVQISDKLIGEQREALIAATSDANAVSVIQGNAGAGKAFTMASIAEQYRTATRCRVLPLSERFPSILNGDPAEVDVVKTGLDALRLRSIQLRAGLNPSTIIVADSNEKLSLDSTRDLINKAAEVHRFDQQPEKSVSTEKVKHEAVSLEAANMESSRRLAERIELERAREAERSKTI